MNRCTFLWMAVLGLFVGLTDVWASAGEDGARPFVGKWGCWKDGVFRELELDLYGEAADGAYGLYCESGEDAGMECRIAGVLSVGGNVAEVMVDDGTGRQKASLAYDAASGQLSLDVPGRFSVVFGRQDKYGFVFVNMGDRVNVRSTPVSGTSLLKARRGQSFRFLGKEQGWFKVGLSADGTQAGYISPEYVSYLKENDIPDEAFAGDYVNGQVSLLFERHGGSILMVKTTMRPSPDGSFLPALVQSYLGREEGNAVVFTHVREGYPAEPDARAMSRIEPCAVYYWKESGMFILEGENYSNEM